MDWAVLVLAVLGLGVGLGLHFFKFVPKMVVRVLSLVATVVLAVMFYNLLGLPAVELLDSLLGIQWLFGLVLGYLVGDRIGDMFR